MHCSKTEIVFIEKKNECHSCSITCAKVNNVTKKYEYVDVLNRNRTSVVCIKISHKTYIYSVSSISCLCLCYQNIHTLCTCSDSFAPTDIILLNI